MGSLMMIGAAMGFGLSPMLAQMLLSEGFSPEVIALFRFGIPALLVLPYLKGFLQEKGEYLRCIALGVFSALGMLAFLYSFTWLPASRVILAYYTYPLFAILIGWLLFGHQLTRNRLISAALILLAVSVLQDNNGASTSMLWAGVIVFIAPISYALLINYFANPVKELKTGERMCAMLIGHLLILIPLPFWQLPDIVIPQTTDQLGLILALGLMAAALPQYLFAKGVTLAGMERSTMISTSEIVFALLFGVALLGQEISRLEIIASALIVLASLIRPEPDEPKARGWEIAESSS